MDEIEGIFVEERDEESIASDAAKRDAGDVPCDACAEESTEPEDGFPCACEDDCECIELEFDEDDIVGYIYDENDREIGIVVLEDGEEVEYYYDEEEDSEEVMELEFDEDDIVGYIVDEDDREIGFIVLEDGEEVEYYFAEEEPSRNEPSGKAKDDADEWVISKETFEQASSDMSSLAKDGAEVARELKSAYNDIMGNFDFLSKKSKK